MMGYEVEIVETRKIRLAGLYVRANFSDVPDVCHKLWERFVPRLEEIQGIVGRCSFGVSANMREDGGFDYWAAVETLTEHVPEGMSVLEIDAGKYAKCTVKDLAAISQAYAFLYGEWERDGGVSLNRMKPCYELYQEDWMTTGRIEIYVPVLES